jgi:hypothetical protein
MHMQDITDLIELWVETRHLSRRKTAFLETVYNQMENELLMGGYPLQADLMSCQEVGVDPGSFWVQVVGGLLDQLNPEDGSRYQEITNTLYEMGVLPGDEDAEDD